MCTTTAQLEHLNNYFIFNYVYISVYELVSVDGQSPEASDPPGPEVTVIVSYLAWELELELWSSVRPVCALNC